MSISNCSACSASAFAQPITGAVAQKDQTTGQVEPVSAVKPLTKRDDTVEAANVGNGLNSDTLAAVLGFAG